MKMAVIWVVVQCRVIALLEAVQTSETLVNSYQSTWRCDPEDSRLHICIDLIRLKKCN
jgi:hypothetical protein